MAENNNKFNETATKAGKSVSSLFSKAKQSVVNALDVNGDGTLALDDLKVVTDTLGEKANSAINTLKESAAQKKYESEINALQPFFAENITDTNFALPKFLHISEIDRKHSISELCKGAIGHYTDMPDIKLMTIYPNAINQFGITLYPDAEHDFYYVDPVDRNRYIAVDSYFDYLKIARVTELQRIAQSLGATYFKVTLKQIDKSNDTLDASGKSKFKSKAVSSSAAATHSEQTKEAHEIEVSAELTFVGRAPVRPELKYLKNDHNVLNLIEMRMDPDSPVTKQVIRIELSNSSYIKKKDAAVIDAAMKSIKGSANLSVAKSLQMEERRYFEYKIDFTSSDHS